MGGEHTEGEEKTLESRDRYYLYILIIYVIYDIINLLIINKEGSERKVP